MYKFDIYKRIYMISVSITAIVVYFTWHATRQINLATIESTLLNMAINMGINFITAYGFFKFCVNGLVSLGNTSWGRKLILRSSCIEGVWVGYSYLKDSKAGGKQVMFTIEWIEQSLDSFFIIGVSYNEAGEMRSFWNTVDLVKMDISKRSLDYVYSSNNFERDDSSFGIAHFRYLKAKKKSSKKMIGFTENLANEKEMLARAVQIPKVDAHSLSQKELLEKARKFFEEEEIVQP